MPEVRETQLLCSTCRVLCVWKFIIPIYQIQGTSLCNSSRLQLLKLNLLTKHFYLFCWLKPKQLVLSDALALIFLEACIPFHCALQHYFTMVSRRVVIFAQRKKSSYAKLVKIIQQLKIPIGLGIIFIIGIILFWSYEFHGPQSVVLTTRG